MTIEKTGSSTEQPAIDLAIIAAARKLAESKRYKPKLKDGKPVEFFTWFYFDPSQPDRADISVEP